MTQKYRICTERQVGFIRRMRRDLQRRRAREGEAKSGGNRGSENDASRRPASAPITSVGRQTTRTAAAAAARAATGSPDSTNKAGTRRTYRQINNGDGGTRTQAALPRLSQASSPVTTVDDKTLGY